MGKSLAENFPKKERNNAASVDFLEPVLPIIAVTNFGSYPAIFKKWNKQITKSELDKFEKIFDEIILKAVSDNTEIIELENPTTKFCEKLRSLLDSGRCYVEIRGAESSSRQKNCLGLQDDES